MKTYHIHCGPPDQQSYQESIVEIIRRHKDVIINKADETVIEITIEKDNPEADEYYQELLEVINHELHLAVH